MWLREPSRCVILETRPACRLRTRSRGRNCLPRRTKQVCHRATIAAIQGIKGYWHGELELAFCDIPDLHFAKSAGRATGDQQRCGIRRELDRLDPLGKADQPMDATRTVCLPDQHFMEASDC